MQMQQSPNCLHFYAFNCFQATVEAESQSWFWNFIKPWSTFSSILVFLQKAVLEISNTFYKLVASCNVQWSNQKYINKTVAQADTLTTITVEFIGARLAVAVAITNPARVYALSARTLRLIQLTHARGWQKQSPVQIGQRAKLCVRRNGNRFLLHKMCYWIGIIEKLENHPKQASENIEVDLMDVKRVQNRRKKTNLFLFHFPTRSHTKSTSMAPALYIIHATHPTNFHPKLKTFVPV